MFLFVICLNVSLALVNVWVAIRLYQYYRQLQRLTHRLDRLERCAHRLCRRTPATLQMTAQSCQRFRHQYGQVWRRWLILQELWQLWRLWGKLRRSPTPTP